MSASPWRFDPAEGSTARGDTRSPDRLRDREAAATGGVAHYVRVGARGEAGVGGEVCRASANETAASVTCPAAGQPRVANTTTWTYNTAGQVTAMTDPEGNTTNTVYDDDGNQTQVTDPAGNVTKNVYDLDNELTDSTVGYGTTSAATTSYGYLIAPGSGPCSSSVSGTQSCNTVTDPKGYVTVDYFDALGHKIKETIPAEGSTSYTYDDAGNELTETTAAGETQYGYDAADRRISVSYPTTVSGYTAPADVAFTYDAAGNRTRMSDGTGTTSYSYDSLERLTTVVNGAGSEVDYAYNDDNQITDVTYPSGDAVHYSFDNAGRTIALTDWLSNATSFGYDHNSNLTSEALPNGDSSTVTVNHDDQITAISDAPTSTPSSPFATFSYTRNADQQVATESDTGVPTPTSQTYGYDPLKRVASDSSGSYAYNVGGDPTTLANGTSQTFATNGQLTDSVDSGSHHTTYGYNSRGDRTSTTLSGSTVALAYDQDDRLISYGSSAAYTYNGDGLRASKTVSSTTEAFTWDGNTPDGIPHVLVDGSTSYVYDPVGHPLEQITSGGSVTYYLHDQLGSTRLLRSSSGTTTASYTYDSYGGPAGSTGTATNPLRYVGSYTDTESGLIYLINRYYDPAAAVFLSVDPLVVVTLQPYDYAGQDPINGYDPTGAVNEEVGAYMAGGRQGGDAGTGEGEGSVRAAP